MVQKPLFSIIVPVYNVEEYINFCLSSILNQTCKDFELIIVNDGSTDRSMELALAQVCRDSRVIVISQINSGLSSARNKGLSMANGIFAFFVDSDDYIDERTLENLSSIIVKNKNVDLIAFSALPFCNDTEKTKEDLVANYKRYYSRKHIKSGLYSGRSFYKSMSSKDDFVSSACLYISKIDVIRRCKLTFFEGIIHEDELFTRHILHCTSTVFFTKEKYYMRRIRSNSITQSEINENKVYSYVIIAEQLFRLARTYKSLSLMKEAKYFFDLSLDLAIVNFKNDRKMFLRFLRTHPLLIFGSFQRILKYNS